MKPRPVGRPPRSAVAATERLELRLTIDEMKRWRRAAGKQSLAAWIRAACERYAVLG